MRKQKRYKVKFNEVFFNNRWKRPKWNRNAEWCIVGIGKRYFNPNEFEYYFNFFGFDFRFWFIKEFTPTTNE